MGAQNALWLTAQVLLTQRRTAWDDPAIPPHFWNTALPFARDPVDQHGLPPLRRLKQMWFSRPQPQCPTAATMPMLTSRLA
jgi:GntR family transcriptional regulator/MocR family aminotransferase